MLKYLGIFLSEYAALAQLWPLARPPHPDAEPSLDARQGN
jgi:hypothetical protein